MALSSHPLAQRRAQHLVEAVLGGIGNDRLQRLPLLRRGAVRRLEQRGVDGFAQQRLRRLVVEHGEPRRDVGFEGEALQQALAERMDGLHLEAAGRLDGDGKQRARMLDLAVERRPVAQLGDLAASFALGIVTQFASVSNTRLAISAAAALV